ncbi:MAG TPA: hypothetical protein DD635_01795 [Flavobacteriales bacterium]|nr:hypothetical protein [Flavobacteriales bacterium]|tara:strand:- start:923 stop:1855 length:933 start_codon:yes stop_codon:yes gene_type:complete
MESLRLSSVQLIGPLKRYVTQVILLLAVLLGALSSSTAQSELTSFIDLYAQIQESSDDTERLTLSEQISSVMVSHWSENQLEEDAHDVLGSAMGFAQAGSGKERLTIVSWNVELKNQTHAYGAVVVFNGKKGIQQAQSLRFKRPTALRSTLDDQSRYTSKEWPGAIYYEVLLRHLGNRPVYTLLGWDGADNIKTRKVVETLTVSGNKLKFGVPIISAGLGSTKRYILEYSDQVSAILQWREDLDMIIMDHLSPPNPDLAGQTSFYGPDMSYDGFIWKKNRWVLEEDVDVRDPDLRTPWNNPKRLQRRYRN